MSTLARHYYAMGGYKLDLNDDLKLEPSFLLKYVEDMGYDEMSQLTGVGVSALKMRVMRACDRLRELRIHRQVNLSLDDLAEWLNPILAGWMNYYGRYYRSALYPLLRRVSTYLRRWAGKKYRRLRTHKRFIRWWTGLLEREPRLFAHWRWVRAY